ncbi:hypothetical protein ACOSQ2_013264 [Xanthoceras sorbifolium]
MMSQQSQGTGSLSPADLPVKRKRGRPRKDDSNVQGDSIPIMPVPDSGKKNKQTAATSDPAADDMVGQVVSGFIEGSFDAGYLLNVRVGDTDTHLRGLVFLPGRFIPVTAANDVAPNVRMYTRKEIPIPVQNPQTQPCDFVPASEPISKQATEVKIDEPKFPDQVVVPSELQSGIPVTGENQSASVMLPLGDNLPRNETGLAFGERILLQKISDSGQESQTAAFMEQLKRDKAVEQDEVQQGTNMEIETTKEPESASALLVDITPSTGNINQEPQVENQALRSDLKPNELVHNEVKDLNNGDNKPALTAELVHNEVKDLNNEDNKTALTAEPESVPSEPVGISMLMEKPSLEDNQTPLFGEPESMPCEPIGISMLMEKPNLEDNQTPLFAEPQSMPAEPIDYGMLMEKPNLEHNQNSLFAEPKSMFPESIGINFHVDKQNSPKKDTQDTPSELANKALFGDDTSYPVGETANITVGGSYSVPMTNLSIMLFEGETVPSQPGSLGNEGSVLPRMIDSQMCSSSGATSNGDSSIKDAITATHLELSSSLNLSGSG